LPESSHLGDGTSIDLSPFSVAMSPHNHRCEIVGLNERTK